MTVAFGEVTFDQVDYDKDADVLYLSVGGVEPIHREETPEGNVLRFDKDGDLCGITIIGLSDQIDSEGSVEVTVPRREALDLPELAPA